jgi:hypothetical protein
MNVIKGVEIFKPGTHNGDTYTEQDLDDIVAASRQLDFRPALKIGHTKDEPGAPAYGWITNLRKAGGKLVADFESMHESVTQALRDRRYDRVSSEIYFNLKRGGQTFRRALKAVALLGAEVPAVAGLVPLHKMEFAGTGDAESVGVFETTLKGIEMERADLEVDRRTQQRMHESGEKDYIQAMDWVLVEFPELARHYREEQDAVALGTYARD